MSADYVTRGAVNAPELETIINHSVEVMNMSMLDRLLVHWAGLDAFDMTVELAFIVGGLSVLVFLISEVLSGYLQFINSSDVKGLPKPVRDLFGMAICISFLGTLVCGFAITLLMAFPVLIGGSGLFILTSFGLRYIITVNRVVKKHILDKEGHSEGYKVPGEDVEKLDALDTMVDRAERSITRCGKSSY